MPSTDYMTYADIRDQAAKAARWAQEALEAARTIRDRADAAHARGLRPDDVHVIRDAQVTLTAAKAMLAADSDELKGKVDAL
jgi:hypothetical protein